MKLIKYENYQVVPTDELFYVKTFRMMYNKDRSVTKEKFMETLSFIYHFSDPRSSYADIFDDEQRMQAIITQEGMSSDFKITKEIEEAIDVYKKYTTTTSQKLLNSMRRAVVRLGEFMENFDPYSTDDVAKQAQAAKTLSSITGDAPQLAKKLIETEKIVNAEINEGGRIRGGDEQAHAFEKGF